MSMTIGSATSGLATSSAADQLGLFLDPHDPEVIAEARGLLMLKKGMDASSSTAAQLIQQMAPPPSHLGQSVNTLA